MELTNPHWFSGPASVICYAKQQEFGPELSNVSWWFLQRYCMSSYIEQKFVGCVCDYCVYAANLHENEKKRSDIKNLGTEFWKTCGKTDCFHSDWTLQWFQKGFNWKRSLLKLGQPSLEAEWGLRLTVCVHEIVFFYLLLYYCVLLLRDGERCFRNFLFHLPE